MTSFISLIFTLNIYQILQALISQSELLYSLVSVTKSTQMRDIKSSPKFYIWKSSRLYIGINHEPFRKHTYGWSQLVVCLHGKIRIKLSDGTEVTTRSCMIKAGTVVKEQIFNTHDTVIAIYYLNPISQEYLILQNQMTSVSKGVSYNHPTEGDLAQLLRHIMMATVSPNQAHRLFKDALIEPHLRQTIVKKFDPRIIKILQHIRENFSDNIPMSDYAVAVHLSESRLNKLFKEQMGIPITKYRLQFRVSIGIILLAAGYPVTVAAYEAGFSSSAHFSTCFSDMVGVQPSTDILKLSDMNLFISKDVIKAFIPADTCKLG